MSLKRACISTTIDNADRISNLPECILCHILSFLPTEDSVRTRVLSSRWKNLFSLVPVLAFSSTATFNTNGARNFLDFVNWVFNSYNVNHMDTFRFSSSTLETFHLCTSRLYHRRSALLRWISDSVSRRVRKLELDVSFDIPQVLPCDLFTSKTLSVLRIRGCFTLDVPQDACLPCVKTIDLVGISFTDDSSAQRLFRCCPVLEELYINYRCSLGHIQVLDISVSSLKTLTIYHGYENKFDLVLDIPNVENFVYIGRGMAHRSYSLRGLKSSGKAYIRLYQHYQEGQEALEKLVRDVCHIQHLRIHGFMFEGFLRSEESFPVFSNLTHLEIGSISCSDPKWVVDLLERTPQLQVLLVDNVGFSPEDGPENGDYVHFSPERVPICVSLRLKLIELRGFLKMEPEFKMVEYFLKNAEILDMLKILFTGNLGSMEKHHEMRNKLMSFSRYSRACKIVLVSEMGET